MAGTHPRNTLGIAASPCCGAKTRRGDARPGRGGSGAPAGNRNALKHVLHTKAAIAEHEEKGAAKVIGAGQDEAK